MFRDNLFIESLKDYIKIHTTTKTIITQFKITAIEQRLPDMFLRIHRSRHFPFFIFPSSSDSKFVSSFKNKQ